MSKIYKVVHKKSNVLVNGEPKLPTPASLEYGEIAINYAQSGETLSIKNSADQIVTFPSANRIDSMIEGSVSGLAQTIEDVEEVTSSALGDLSDRLDIVEGSGFTAGLVASVQYSSQDSRIYFYDKNGTQIQTYVDTTDFIKDGMVDTATVATPTGGTNSGVTCLVITFNTDAGKEDIEIPLSNIFNPSNYFTKTETENNFLTTATTIPSTAAEVGAMATSERSNYLPTGTTLDNVADGSTRKLSNYSTTAHTHTAAEVGAMATSERDNYSTTGHTHSEYSTTAHTHTAAEVGAMATSERGNYLPTGTTLDNVSDGSTRKLSDYSTTAHTHTAAEVGAMATSERSNYLPTGTTLDNVTDGTTRKLANYSTTAHTHTAAEVGAISTADTGNFLTTAATASDVGAMATSERGNYLTTATTIPSTAAEVGAMATSERSNYLPTGTTLDNVADGSTRKLSDYSTTGHTHSIYSTTAHTHSEYSTTAHTHTAAEVGAMATSERSNYLPTGTTLDNVADGTTRKLSDYSTTGHTHSQYATTAHTHDYLPLSGGDVTGTIYAINSQDDRNYVSINNRGIGFSVSAGTGNESMSLLPYWYSATTFGSHLLWLPNKSNATIATTDDIPTEANLVSSGFTKNAITGINVNGSAATVTNGVAEINVQGGGGSTLPSVTAADNGKVLMVVNGAWAAVMPTTVYTGTDTPLSSIGNDGDIYLQTS